MHDPYFEPLLKLWEDSEDDNNNNDDDEDFGDSLDEWPAYVPDID